MSSGTGSCQKLPDLTQIRHGVAANLIVGEVAGDDLMNLMLES